MSIFTKSRWVRSAVFVAATLSASSVSAACVDLSKGNRFILTRNTPHFQVENVISADGSVSEDRVMEKGGARETVQTAYWNGIMAVDRKSASSRIQMKVPAKAKSLDLSVKGKEYTLPMTLLINGKEFGRGTYIVRPIKKTKVKIGKCRYPVMVVRTTMRLENRADINEEALLSLEAGMLIGNVAMDPEWNPKSGVFFDTVQAR